MPDTSIDTFLRARQRGDEPILGFKWVCTGLPYGLPLTYVESVQVSWVKLNVKDGLFAAATYSYYPGFSDIDSFTMTFHESVRTATTKWLLYWMSRIKNFSTGTYFLPGHYKEDISLSLLDNQNRSVLDITMKDCWPIVRDPIDLNYHDPASRIQLSVSFSVDDQEVRPTNLTFGSPGAKSAASIFTADGTATPGKSISPVSSSSTGFNPSANTVAQQQVTAASGLAKTTNAAGVTVPLQNPVPAVPGAFDAAGNAAATAPAAEEPSLFTKVWTATKDAVTKYTEPFKDGMVAAIKDGKPTSIAELKTIVTDYATGPESITMAAGIGASASKPMFEDLVKTPASEREAKQEENSSFLAEIGSSLRYHSEDYADSIITTTENANPSDPIDLQNIADYTASSNTSWIDGMQDDTTTSAKKYYEKYKTDKEKAEEAAQNNP